MANFRFLSFSLLFSLFFSLLLTPSLLFAANPGAPSHLRSFDKVNPVGTDNHPYFGWYVNDSSVGALQSAYQILVASAPEKLETGVADIWDSGKVPSATQNHLQYAGKPLASGTRYFWKVRTWNAKGKVSPYSEAATFDVGLLTAADWSGAKWIRRETTDRDNYTYFRKLVSLPEGQIKRAVAYISVWHNYQLYVNGRLAGKGQAYHYPQYSYYNAFDITEQLKPGSSNLFACMAHWFGGGQGRAAGAAGLLMKVVVEYANGTTAVVNSDGTWKQSRVEAREPGQPARGGEGVGYIDKIHATRILKDWNLPSFNDASWAAATEVGSHPTAPWTGELQPDLTRLIEKSQPPLSVTDLGNGKYVIDLGKVYAGTPVIHFSGGNPGDVVNMQGGYVLNEDGTVSTRQNQSTNLGFFFVLDGKPAVFAPVVYFGMRYLQVDNSPCVLTRENVSFTVRYYELDPSRARFSSSNPMLNRVWELMAHTLTLGMQEQFVDTPTREKGAFLGDSWAQGVPAMAIFGDRAYNLRVMLEALDGQDQYWPDGRLNAVYPNSDGKRDIPDYTQSFLVWVWDYYMLTGNLQFLRDNYTKLRKVAEYVSAYQNPETGLIHKLAGGSGPYQYGIIDWPAAMRYGYDMDTEARTVINAYAFADFDIVSKIAGLLGNREDEKLYRDKAEAMKAAINRQLINADGTYIDGLMADKSPSSHVSQHANMMPLALGIVPEANKSSVVDALKERKMSVGMVPLRWLPEAIGKAGEGEHLVELYTNPEWDGWARTLALGGTATWESWDAPERGESLSHPWGIVGLLGIQQFILGVEPLEPQHALVRVKPLDLGQSLLSAEGEIPTDRGPISVNWNRNNQRFLMTVTLPPNVKAVVYLPKAGSTGNQVWINGKKRKAIEEGNYLRIENIGAGKHTFERKIL